MCETWTSLSDEIARIMKGLAVGPQGRDRPTAAQPRASSASVGRAHIGREGRANVLENGAASDTASAVEAISSEAQLRPLTRARRDSVTGLSCRVDATSILTPASPRTAQKPDSNPRDPHTWEPTGIARHRGGLERITAAILEFVPRKGPGTEAPGRFIRGGDAQGGRSQQTVAEGRTATRGSASLAIRIARKL